MNDKLERMNKRKHLLSNEGNRIHLAADDSKVEQLLHSEIDSDLLIDIQKQMEEKYSTDTEITFTKTDVNLLLNSMEEGFKEKTVTDLLEECQKTVLDTCIRQFGLASVLFQDNKGGNVTTIHNAQQGIYAEEKDQYNRATYDRGKNSDGKSFAGSSKQSIGAEFTRNQLDDNQMLTDAYTGKIELGKNTSPDHIEPLSKFHKNGGFMIPDVRKADFATDSDNLASTRRDINQSMLDNEKSEWMDRKSNGRDITNEEYYDIDSELIEKQTQRGRETAQKHAPKTIDKTLYYSSNICKTGVKEGVKMGTQQAIGLVLREITLATFHEAKDIFKNGMSNGDIGDSFWEAFKNRLYRIGLKIKDKWKDILISFKDGMISGFISNLITVITNMFKTTFKNINRIIREGIYSLFKAVKLLASPPAGMLKEQVYHEVTKLISTAIVVTGGILLEEYLDKFLKGMPFVNIILDVITGIITGIATSLILYALDKIDIFGCNRQEKHNFIMDKLNDIIQENHKIAMETQI